MRGKKRKVAEAKKQEENIEDSSVANEVNNDISSMEDQQKSSDKNTEQQEIDSRKLKRKFSDVEEDDKPLKLAETETSESKGDNFHAKMGGSKDIDQTSTDHSLEEQLVSKGKNSCEPLGGSGHMKFSEPRIVLSKLSVDITSNVDIIHLEETNDPASLIHKEIERRNAHFSSDHVHKVSNRKLEDEQPVTCDKAVEDSEILLTNSQSKEKEEKATNSEVFAEATKSKLSEQNEKLHVKGFFHELSDFEQLDLAKPNQVEVDSNVNEVTSGSLNKVNGTGRNETENTKSMQSDGPSEVAISVASKESKVKENPLCLQIISSESVTNTEICSTETCNIADDMILIASVTTNKHVDTVTCDTETKVADAEENGTEKITNKHGALETVVFDADQYGADHIGDINNPNLKDKTAEEIYLQSTDPVNTENKSDCDHHKDADANETGQVLDTEYYSAPGTIADYTDIAREELVFLSPKTAAAAPEMTVDVSDDLTDSQLCAMDWSSQFSLESGVCQKLPQTSLKPEGARLTAKLTPTKSKPEDGTAVVKGLIHELAQLNKSILKTKREMEYARHKRQQNYNLNRR